MKHWYKIILIIAMALISSRAMADNVVQHDTVYFYKSWEQILYMEPAAFIIDPIISVYTPYQVAIETGDTEVNDAIKTSYVAATLGDSIWLVNTDYLKDNFKGDSKKLSEFAPLFFNDKVAFVAYVGYGENISLKTIFFGEWEDVNYDELVDYYYIDFLTSKVIKITSESLSALLEDYHDLQMRYEGMKDYKKDYVIRDYFLKYFERAASDFMHPYILDLVE
ncbi:MAG: hypothetical protein IJK93_08845 [Muribaculaceae bacterium]|nr:hypothetical protein [Muribaculaceae bacterium]